jgi:hypothetical protein
MTDKIEAKIREDMTALGANGHEIGAIIRDFRNRVLNGEVDLDKVDDIRVNKLEGADEFIHKDEIDIAEAEFDDLVVHALSEAGAAVFNEAVQNVADKALARRMAQGDGALGLGGPADFFVDTDLADALIEVSVGLRALGLHFENHIATQHLANKTCIYGDDCPALDMGDRIGLFDSVARACLGIIDTVARVRVAGEEDEPLQY